MDKERIKESVKRFVTNKNTITFFLVIILIVIIYVVYLQMIKTSVSATNIPYSTKTLKAGTVIEAGDIQSIKVAGIFLSSSGNSIIQSRSYLYEKQVAEGYQIPQNSFFYNDAITEKSNVIVDDFTNIPDNYTIYALKVDFHSTYGNSIMPGNYIDLYFSTTVEGKLVYEQFVKSIPVYRVYDGEHKDVFSNTDDEQEAQPKYLYFQLKQDIYELLMVCEKIGDIKIIPVPRNAGYSENPQEMEISNEAIREYIRARRNEIKETN